MRLFEVVFGCCACSNWVMKGAHQRNILAQSSSGIDRPAGGAPFYLQAFQRSTKLLSPKCVGKPQRDAGTDISS